MDVILLQDVEKLGLRGDVVGVARGYARNFLLPRNLAEVATPAKVAELERREARRARHEASTADQAAEMKRLIDELELRFDVTAGPTGTLFGSVTATNVADELWAKKKIRVDRRKIELHDPIKRIGRYTIPIEVFHGVVAELRTLVVPEGGELPPEVEEPEAAEPPVGDGGPVDGVPAQPGDSPAPDAPAEEAERGGFTELEPEPAAEAEPEPGPAEWTPPADEVEAGPEPAPEQ
jgi:large subunit ribosomal protein L9